MLEIDTPTPGDLRQRLKRWYKECQRVAEENRRRKKAAQERWRENPLAPVPRPILLPPPALPEECRGMTCGARTKGTGEPCKRPDVGYNGRCKFHGGMSTGPKTAAGKAKAAKNGLVPKRKRNW